MEIANGADGHNGSAVQWVEGREWSADGAERAQNRQCVVSQIWRWRDGTSGGDWRDYLNEGRDGNERRRPPAEAIFDRTLSAWKRTRVHAYGADDAARLQRLPPQLLRGSTDDYITRCYCNLSRQRLAGHRWESLACDSALREIRVQDPGQDKICGARTSYRAQVRRVPGLLTASRCAAVAVRAAQTRPKPS